MNVLIVCLYNFSLVAGTAYLIALHDWSPLWFLVTLMFMANISKKEEDERK